MRAPPFMPLVHLSWALADNGERPACDAFFTDILGASVAHEILITPETEAMGLDREEKLLVIGNSMLIPIAPAGRGAHEGHPLGDMLRRSAQPMRWIGMAMRVDDLAAADAWFAARGFERKYDPGMEDRYFLVPRWQVMGIRLEIVATDMPGDPRAANGGLQLAPPNGDAMRDMPWMAHNPLGIERLLALGVSTPSLDEARSLFAGRLQWPEVAAFDLPDARCAAFATGSCMLEALESIDTDGAIAQHSRDTKGIYHLLYKVRSAEAAVNYLRGLGLPLIGDAKARFAIAPAAAHGRLIWFTETTPECY